MTAARVGDTAGGAGVRLVVALLLAATLALAGCAEPLPEEGTPAAALYVERCGRCHAAYRPQILTASMWETMVVRMEITMKRRGMPLSPADREEILAYLERNAGTR